MTVKTTTFSGLAERSARTGGDLTRQLLILIGLAGVIAVNALANALPINGQATGDISDRFDVFFVPAGYVFSIWGLIYATLIGYAIYQALPSRATDPLLRRIGYLFVLSCVLNIAWIFLWHYEFFPLTLVAMVGLLLTLIAIYIFIDSGTRPASRAQYWLVHFPFSLYLGWITVATIANATSLLDYWNWNAWTLAPAVWAVLLLAIATTVGTLIGLSRGDTAYVAVLIWAFIGIAAKHWATPMVAYAALVAAVIVAGSLIIGVPRRRQRLAASSINSSTIDKRTSSMSTITAAQESES